MVRQFSGPKSSLQYYEKFILDPRVAEQLPLQELEIFTIDRQGLLKEVVTRLTDSKSNILAANISTHHDKTATIAVVVEVLDIKQLEGVIQKG